MFRWHYYSCMYTAMFIRHQQLSFLSPWVAPTMHWFLCWLRYMYNRTNQRLTAKFDHYSSAGWDGLREFFFFLYSIVYFSSTKALSFLPVSNRCYLYRYLDICFWSSVSVPSRNVITRIENAGSQENAMSSQSKKIGNIGTYTHTLSQYKLKCNNHIRDKVPFCSNGNFSRLQKNFFGNSFSFLCYAYELRTMLW